MKIVATVESNYLPFFPYGKIIVREVTTFGLYLAIAQDVYQDFFQRPAIEEIIFDQQIHLLVFDPNTEEMVQWIK